MAFQFHKLDIPEILHIVPDVFFDDRGAFSEVFKTSVFAQHGINKPLVQFNRSTSNRHVLRGLHYQLNPAAQGKLLSVVSGTIFDVAVDIRKDSPTYGKWVGEELSGQKRDMLYIPEGFAHGFCVTSDSAEVLYYCTGEYSPQHERGILWNDKALAISWPVDSPILAKKDAEFPPLSEAENNFLYE